MANQASALNPDPVILTCDQHRRKIGRKTQENPYPCPECPKLVPKFAQILQRSAYNTVKFSMCTSCVERALNLPDSICGVGYSGESRHNTLSYCTLALSHCVFQKHGNLSWLCIILFIP